MNVLRFMTILFTTIGLSAGLAHVFSLPVKIRMGPEEYLAGQQAYRGWALLGIALAGALLSTLILAILERHDRAVLLLTLTAFFCIALSLAVFFRFTFPANQATANWTTLPETWESLRSQWEYSHAVGAGLHFIAFCALVISLLLRR